MRKFTAGLICLLFLSYAAQAQQLTLKGKIVDSLENRNLIYGTVSLLRSADTTLVRFTRTAANGQFSLPVTDTGKYLLFITYPRFADFMEKIDIQANMDLGNIFLTLKSKVLEEVVIRSGSAIRIKGDTTEFVADSFKLREGATVEDLLRKLPGFSVDSKGEITAQGKRVDKVLVDGEEFFGDDPTMATRNISGKAVDRVQVYETKTEQQQLTGITTGNEGKTVNIKLKEDYKKGSFGKINAGTDDGNYHDGRAMYNRFIGKKKMSAYLTKTNVNAGSLDWEEQRKLGIEEDYEYDEISGYYFSFGGGDDFNNWNLRGLPDATTGGALLIDKWNEDKHSVNTSYRFNRLQTNNEGNTLMQNILPTGLTYSNTFSTVNSLNQQQALNGKYEWKPDSLVSFRLITAYKYRTGDVAGINNSEFLNADGEFVNQGFRNYTNNTKRHQSDNQFLYKQLFRKKNRIWQTTLRYGITDDENEGFNNTVIRYYNSGVFNFADTIDQQKVFDGRSTTMGIKTTFSEPLSERFTLVLDYAFNKNHSLSFRNTFEKDIDGKYEVLIPTFSNNFELDAYSNSGSALLRYNWKKLRMAMGSGVSAVKLLLEDKDAQQNSRYNFLNLTPQAQIGYQIKAQTNLSFSYRGNNRQPTINQLQPLRDNTDPLNEYQGNPDLKVGFTHNISMFFNDYKVLKQRGIWLNAGYTIQENAITQFNTIDESTGKRTYYPVNVNGNNNWYWWSSWNKGGGEGKPHFGLNLNGNGSRFINFVNGEKVVTNSGSVSIGPNVGVFKEEKYSFNISPRLAYNFSKASLSTAIDNNYFSYGGNLNTFVMLPGKIELNTSLNADLRQRIQAFASNVNLVIWNASIGKKIFKDKSGKIIFDANDMLNENKGFTRTISNTFITDDRFQRVSRYFLLRFEWSFNKMPGGEKK